MKACTGGKGFARCVAKEFYGRTGKMTVTETIEKAKQEICDGYCKWQSLYTARFDDPDEAYEHMLEEKCDKCPLQTL